MRVSSARNDDRYDAALAQGSYSRNDHISGGRERDGTIETGGRPIGGVADSRGPHF